MGEEERRGLGRGAAEKLAAGWLRLRAAALQDCTLGRPAAWLPSPCPDSINPALKKGSVLTGSALVQAKSASEKHTEPTARLGSTALQDPSTVGRNHSTVAWGLDRVQRMYLLAVEILQAGIKGGLVCAGKGTNCVSEMGLCCSDSVEEGGREPKVNIGLVELVSGSPAIVRARTPYPHVHRIHRVTLEILVCVVVIVPISVSKEVGRTTAKEACKNTEGDVDEQRTSI